MTLPGQSGIRLREALAAGRWQEAAASVPQLDEAHRIELLLGAAIRDARGGWAAARAWLRAEGGEGSWEEVCRLLAEGEPDTSLDQLASAYVAASRAPLAWRPDGRALDRDIRPPEADIAVAAALLDGVSGRELLAVFVDLPLHPAVAWYYSRGRIHALGVRPLLILAASAG
jgi:hypothetical protein